MASDSLEKKKVKSGSTFETDHLYLAAYLICRRHELLSLMAGDGGRFHFVFSDSPEVRSSAGEYMSGGLVEARQFAFELVKLKRQIPRHWDMRDVKRASYAADQKHFERSS